MAITRQGLRRIAALARGHAGGGCFPNILRMMERGRIEVAPMITTRFPFSRAMDAVRKSTDRTDGKVMIDYTA